MTFKVIANPTFSFTAKITQVGSAEPLLLPLVGKYKDRDELASWTASLVGRKDIDALPEIVEGWGDGAVILDAEDKPLPFNRASLELVLKTFHASGGEIYSAYMAELTQSRQKN